jgi:hypothetical protein
MEVRNAPTIAETQILTAGKRLTDDKGRYNGIAKESDKWTCAG